jgi:hypothetical protein
VASESVLQNGSNTVVREGVDEVGSSAYVESGPCGSFIGLVGKARLVAPASVRIASETRPDLSLRQAPPFFVGQRRKTEGFLLSRFEESGYPCRLDQNTMRYRSTDYRTNAGLNRT